ncbi:hypothetical protein LTS09_016330 [Friedmanniomyces endolithicus]|uniref:Mid2 domain-containing protein n=1 Tax=Friedmanniomyces endolithicus TaxID=329885 RepID=A0AAN6FUZ4_9PEZI|nr:hypothetical protein LTS09_016330 [Friedmanniomyces endolithicus]KAK0323813.1 hypothetical protein LTR82_004933 [Friedmanniomyces endolithicus]
MRASFLLLLHLLTGHALAQTATITEYVTVPPTATSSLSAGGPVREVTSDATSNRAEQSTLVTSASSTLSSEGFASTPAPVAIAQASSNGTSYDGGSSGSGAAVNTDAGASGSGSSFSISKGGLAAIIVVVVIVALLGIASTILFVVAKRRQWDIRASIRRASRRITGRGGAPPTPRTPGANNRRTAVTAGRLASPRVDGRSAKHAGHTAGLGVGVGARDVEKGRLGIGASGTAKPQGRGWQKLWGNDWK